MRKVVVVVLLLLAVFTFINAYTSNDQVGGAKTKTAIIKHDTNKL